MKLSVVFTVVGKGNIAVNLAGNDGSTEQGKPPVKKQYHHEQMESKYGYLNDKLKQEIIVLKFEFFYMPAGPSTRSDNSFKPAGSW